MESKLLVFQSPHLVTEFLRFHVNPFLVSSTTNRKKRQHHLSPAILRPVGRRVNVVSGPVAPLGFLLASLLGSNRPSALAPSAASAGRDYTLRISFLPPWLRHRGLVRLAAVVPGRCSTGWRQVAVSQRYVHFLARSPAASLRVAGKDELPGCQRLKTVASPSRTMG